ncbi:stathmin [Strongylocentrotus purpuratus]|uniref:Stathmin n=1 Tax=Strongylocentrotus purpuratus TaxID=7668 RepID=A0A7M7TGK9_STRPU|nr:stathmin [Strongylocentrotus purpuratus]|eukprot:XP_011679024.1 PREDICTED: stathmin [Strongylocentrotus purpuratus]
MPSEVKTPGGMAFECILDENKKPDTSKRPATPPKSKSTTSLDEINAKLQEAERRRRSVETQMLEKLAEENARILEAQAKVAEKNNNFKMEAKKQYVEKMTKVEINQQAQQEAFNLKLQEKKNHIKVVQERNMRKKEIGDGGDAEEKQ